MSLNAYNPKTKRWEEFETFPQTYHEDGDFWHWANGFVYRNGRWVHAWRTIDTTVTIPAVVGTYTYTRNASGSVVQTVQLSYDSEHSEIVEADSTLSASNAGTYSVVFKLKDRHSQWSDGTLGRKTITWTIEKRNVTIPTVRGTYTFTKSNASAVTIQTVVFNNEDTNYINRINTDSTWEAGYSGTYDVHFGLKDASNTFWSDGTTSNKLVQWTINKRTLSFPTQSGSLTYNGSSQTPSWSNFNTYYMTISGTTNGTNAGTYNVSFKLTNKNDTQWSNYSTEDYATTWQISAAKLTKPYLSTYSISYTGSAITITNYLYYYDSSTMSASGDIRETNAGSYSFTVSLRNSTNYHWSDNTTGDLTYNWSITAATVAKPYVSGTPTYTGSTIYVSNYLSGYDSSLMSLSGDTSETNAGSYTVTVSLKNSDYKWSDGTSSPISLSWRIAKKSVTVSGDTRIDLIPGSTSEKSYVLTFSENSVYVSSVYTSPDYSDSSIRVSVSSGAKVVGSVSALNAAPRVTVLYRPSSTFSVGATQYTQYVLIVTNWNVNNYSLTSKSGHVIGTWGDASSGVYFVQMYVRINY